MTPKTKSLIQLNIAVLLWGGTAMFAKGVDLPVTHIICLRSLVAAGAILAFLAVMKTPVRVKSLSHAAVMLALGLLLGLHWLTYFKALQVSTAAVAILALHTYPVLTALIEPFVFGERLRKSDAAAAAAVFVGLLIMTPEFSLSNATSRGIALGIVSGVFFMIRNLLTRRFVREYASSTLMFWQVLVTGVALLPFLFHASDAAFPVKTVGLLVLLGIVFTALPQTLFSAAFEHLSAKTVSILATLLPFYGAALGYLIHDETVTLRTAVGGLIVLACIVFETARNVGSASTTAKERESSP